MGTTIQGLDEFQKHLERIEEAANELDGTHSVSITELFTRSFMKEYTNFTDFNEFLVAGNFIVNSQEDFDAIPDDELDLHVGKTTKFSSWQDMLDKAGEEYILNELGF